MIKNYNEALDKVRKRVMNKFPKKSVEYYLLKKFNWTLFKDEVRENESKWNKKLHRYINYPQILDLILGISDELRTAYYLKSDYVYFNKHSNLENAENDKISFIDAEYLIGMQRIHSVIQKWQELLHKQEVIFESRNNFMTVINDLLQRKELSLNIRNELQVETQSGKIFPLSNLSSGEKQLLIIFGETLLQRSEPHIFIADEPQLSLHVEWQEKLVQGLKILNPYSQMIFATHSPDIVGKYQNSVINIENCIS